MNQLVPISSHPLPALVAAAGDQAGIRFLEFFAAQTRNPHTRRAYYRSAFVREGVKVGKVLARVPSSLTILSDRDQARTIFSVTRDASGLPMKAKTLKKASISTC